MLVATALLVLAVVGGWLLLSAGRTTTRAIPALVDTSGSSARSLLVELGWLVEERYDRRDGSLEGQVLSMQPPGGTRLEAGETVVLVVSLGPARLPVPDDLVGVSVEEAGRRLEAAGLALGTVSSEKDEAVAVGLVLSVITVDETLPQGSEVDLVVSGGPLPRVVPEGLVGLMPADVVAELIALRLAPTMGEEHDEWIAAGRVSRVEPVGGTRIQVNDDVRVVVSLGAKPRPVPSLQGLSLVAAESRLAASGFRTVVVEGLPEGLAEGEVADRTLLVVVSQTPPAGRREMPTTTVTLVVRPA